MKDGKLENYIRKRKAMAGHRGRKAKISEKIPLFVSIAVWVVVATLAFAILSYVWTGWCLFSPFQDSSGTSILDKVQTVLLIIGGIGAVSYLVIKYYEVSAGKRAERRELEDRLEHKMTNAIGLLGSDAHSTKIAGAYALVDVSTADPGKYGRRIVDVLCGYLRTPRSEDGSVESTVLYLLSEQYKSDNEILQAGGTLNEALGAWGAKNVDLHGATLNETVPFSGSCFFGKVNCDRTSFFGVVSFSDSFIPDANFSDAEFFEECYFRGVEFLSQLSFAGASFFSTASFTGSHFDCDVDFLDSFYEKDSTFLDSHFYRNAVFSKALFCGLATFEKVTFCEEAEDEDLSRYEAMFSEATFQGAVSFLDASFAGRAVFSSVTFMGDCCFRNAIFHGGADFSEARFSRTARLEFPSGLPLNSEGLPQGAIWME